MALSADEQELFDIGRDNLPEWYASDSRANEFLGAAAKITGSARAIASRWLREATLLTLASADVDEPDFLDQHARDRGTSRQSGESDEALVKRLRTVEDALTRPFLLAQVQAMMTAAGFAGTPVMVELPRDAAFFGRYLADGGEGAYTCTALGSNRMSFTLPAGQSWARPPFQRSPSAAPTFKLTLSSGGANDGTFVITGLDGDKALYTNASGSTETVAPTSDWSVDRYDVDDNLRTGTINSRCYFSRGYRMAHNPPSAIIVILPFGTTEGFAASVLEMLRQKKGGGIRAAVERRLSP